MSSVISHATNISATAKEHLKVTLDDFYGHMNRLMYRSPRPKADASTSGMLMTGSLVETNNFRQVIERFNDSGKLKNRTTRLTIECQICMCKNLAILNHGIDKLSNEEHERYAVLPRCGHAFGSRCLQQWIDTQPDGRAQCPTCRTPIDCDSGHAVDLPTFHCRGGENSQRKAIGEIRELLKGQCIQCQEERQRERRQPRALRRRHAVNWVEDPEEDGIWWMFPRPANGTVFRLVTRRAPAEAHGGNRGYSITETTFYL